MEGYPQTSTKEHQFFQRKKFKFTSNTLQKRLYTTWILTMTGLTQKASGPKVIKLFSCSTQHSMKFSLLINVKMPTNVGILTFMSRKNSILGLSEP